MTSPIAHPIRVVALLTLVAAVLVLLLAGGVAASTTGSETAYQTYRVAVGDTLWEIAADHMDPGDDVRKMVFRIREVNDLDEAVIFPGQELRIPIG
jgi:hypothetical protein